MTINIKHFAPLFFIFMSTIAFAGEVEANLINTTDEVAVNEINIRPRFFSDKLFVKSDVETPDLYMLFLYFNKGEYVTRIPIDLSKGDFVYFAETLKAGEYTYFIREKNQLIVKGTFLK